MSDNVIDLDDQNFDDEVYRTELPALVEFCSERSYACRELSATIDQLADEFSGKVLVGRLDMDANWQTAQALDARVAPAVWLFQNGQIVDRIEGAKTREEYRQAINEMLAPYWVI